MVVVQTPNRVVIGVFYAFAPDNYPVSSRCQVYNLNHSLHALRLLPFPVRIPFPTIG